MSQAKKCPRCGRIVDLETASCPVCSHHFRTLFDPQNPQVSSRAAVTPLQPEDEAPPARTLLVHLRSLREKHAIRGQSAGPSSLLLTLAVLVGLALLLSWVGVLVFRHA